MLKTLSITVSGKVQGVFFRQTTKEKARELGLTGEVKNLENGNVLILATGTDEQLNTLSEWCKQGPPRAIVTAVEIRELSLQTFERFVVLR